MKICGKNPEKHLWKQKIRSHGTSRLYQIMLVHVTVRLQGINTVVPVNSYTICQYKDILTTDMKHVFLPY